VCRLDKNRVADATVKGGLARYINHCCDPNCKTKAFFYGPTGPAHMGIYARRDIDLGEELHYDYQVGGGTDRGAQGHKQHTGAH
jgi:histone-lysine N-methyltransferase SETD1